MNTPTDEHCILSCERLVVASYSLMDLGRYEACADLFAPTATWVRGGKPVTGKEAILASLCERPSDHATRHLVTNVMVSQTGQDAAEATAVFVPLRGKLEADGLAGAPRFEMVGDLTYRFERIDGCWLISHLQPKPIFRG
jgi:hypothetical protein